MVMPQILLTRFFCQINQILFAVVEFETTFCKTDFVQNLLRGKILRVGHRNNLAESEFLKTVLQSSFCDFGSITFTPMFSGKTIAKFDFLSSVRTGKTAASDYFAA